MTTLGFFFSVNSSQLVLGSLGSSSGTVLPHGLIEHKALVIHSDSIFLSLLQEELEKSGVYFTPAKSLLITKSLLDLVLFS